MGIAGWLGGHLSYAMGVGIDTTAFLRPATEWTDACPLGELDEGTPYAVTVEDTPVLLVRHGGRVSAIAERRTHRGAPLHEGHPRGRVHHLPVARCPVPTGRRRCRPWAGHPARGYP